MSLGAGRRTIHRSVGRLFLLLALLSALGCRSAIQRVGIRLYYQPVTAQTDIVVRPNLAYRTDEAADAHKHRLDLYQPTGSGWPILLFVHGGGFTDGDRTLVAGGEDVYGNIGRFYAARGIGVAVISYRLQPQVDWPLQVDDVARAAAWVRTRLAAWGGDGRLYLAGHSAGAWLAARVALDPEVQHSHGLTRGDFAGVVAVSGGAYDLEDQITWDLGARFSWFRKRLRQGRSDRGWQRRASVVPLLENSSGPLPPFLLLFTAGEWPSLARQNRVLHAALIRAGGACDLTRIVGESHARMVLAMSRPGSEVAGEILTFLGTELDQPAATAASTRIDRG